MKKSPNQNKNFPFSLLTAAASCHLLSLFCSVYRDTYRWPSGYQEVNYWLYLFSWWCTQTSLITIIYFIYRLFSPATKSYWAKVFDLIVINANLILMGIFTVSAAMGLLPLPRSDEVIKIFFWEVSSRWFWWFYAVIWHYIAPFLTIAYFGRQKNVLAHTYQERKKLFFYSFLHPLFYLVFVLARPLIPYSETYKFTGSESQQYPFFWFDWVGISNWEYLFWLGLVIFFWLIIFWFSTLFFWKYAKLKIKVSRNRSKIRKKVAKVSEAREL